MNWFEHRINFLEDLCQEKNTKVLELTAELEAKNKQIAELEEQLKNALIPKFKVGDTVFVISGKVIKEASIDEIYWSSSKNNFEYFTGIICGLNDIQYETIEEREIFNTKEEALAKLEELRGE